MAAFEYDGIRVKWSDTELETLKKIRERNSEKECDNGNGGNKYQSSGTLPLVEIGRDIYDIRSRWSVDLLEGMKDV